jgi:SAM-dependent methyltransferase
VPQNIYDDPAFFSGYATLPRFGPGWSEAFEHADFMALLPDVADRRVLDLGCGAGQLTRYLADAGAAEAIGIDVSERMLALATSERPHPRVTFRRATMEELAFPPEHFDLVVSSLALHYVEDYADLMRRIGQWLAPGGVLVYSVEHPVYTASYPDLGWATDADGRNEHWRIDNYTVDGLREPHWFVDGVQKYHRSFSTLVNGLVDAGLPVDRLVEPVPTDEALQEHPTWVSELRRPTFLLVRASKR